MQDLTRIDGKSQEIKSKRIGVVWRYTGTLPRNKRRKWIA